MQAEQQRFRVEARCSVLMRAKVAVVAADDKEDAVRKAKEQFKVDVTIVKVEEYHGQEQDHS